MAPLPSALAHSHSRIRSGSTDQRRAAAGTGVGTPSAARYRSDSVGTGSGASTSSASGSGSGSSPSASSSASAASMAAGHAHARALSLSRAGTRSRSSSGTFSGSPSSPASRSYSGMFWAAATGRKGKLQRRRSSDEEAELMGMHRLDGGGNDSPMSSPTSATLAFRRPGFGAVTRWCSPRRVLRSPRRIVVMCLWLLLVLAVGVVLFDPEQGPIAEGINKIFWAFSDDQQPKHPCEFVSAIDAYHQDLARLRAQHGDNSTTWASSSAGATGTHRSRHTFSSTGHLIMSSDPAAPHPIPELITMGERQWEALLVQQSRSLGEAVKTYRQRYNRLPPKGFDKWWAFATAREVVLPDEYDRIEADLAPFRALSKDEMQRRLKYVEDMFGVFTLEVKGGKVNVEIKDPARYNKWKGTQPRARRTASLMRSFSHLLPDMRASFSIFDEPSLYLPWSEQSALVDLAEHGKHTSKHLVDEPTVHVNISESCAPESNLRRNPGMHEGKSFVYDSLSSMDICKNPYIVPLHGLTLQPHDENSLPRPHTQLLPVFGFAKTLFNADIAITPLDMFWDTVLRDPSWERKPDSRLLWRGSPTGMPMMTKDTPWRDSHRVRLHRWANNMTTDPFEFIVPDFETELPKARADGRNQPRRVARETALGYKKVMLPQDVVLDHFFDMKLAGHPIQCSKEDGTCADMKNEFDWAPHQKMQESWKHKFILDIDGNAWSGRFRRLMLSNSLVIKTGIFAEWFQPHLIPWFMYVPARLDFGDLSDIMSFFAGPPSQPDAGFDLTAKALASNGQCFVERMYRYADLEVYMLRLFLEYARLVSPDEDMDFHYDPAVHGDAATGYGGDGIVEPEGEEGEEVEGEEGEEVEEAGEGKGGEEGGDGYRDLGGDEANVVKSADADAGVDRHAGNDTPTRPSDMGDDPALGVHDESPAASGVHDEIPAASGVHDENPAASDVHDDEPSAMGVDDDDDPAALGVDDDDPAAFGARGDDPTFGR